MSTLLIDYELLNRDRYTFSRHLDVQATSLDGPTVHVIEESEGERSVRISSFVGLSAPHELILRTLLVEPMAGRSTIQRRGALGRLTDIDTQPPGSDERQMIEDLAQRS